MKLAIIQRRALEKSIKDKWDPIIDGTGVDKGRLNCELCVKLEYNDCVACPVQRKAGNCYCRETPYAEWIYHLKNEHNADIEKDEFKVQCPTCKKLAIKQRDFLKSLRDTI